MGLIEQHSIPHSSIGDHTRDRVSTNIAQDFGNDLAPNLEQFHKIWAEKIHDMLCCNSMLCVSHD